MIRHGSKFIFLLTLAALSLMPALCSKPTEPTPFLSIRLLSQGDSMAYTGVPIKIYAVLDSAVDVSEISWITGRGEYVRAGNLRPGDLTAADTILLTWQQLPAVPYSAPSDTSAPRRLPIDTIWATYRDVASNKLRVAVLNRSPHIDSIYVNGRKTPLQQDSLHITGNHSTMVYMTLYATDPDTGSRLTAEWTCDPRFGSLVNLVDSSSLTGLQRTMVWRWNIKWQAPTVESVGDSTAASTAALIVHDQNGGSDGLPIRLTIYRETGSIWVASTQENTSTLVKYATNGQELFRIPGFKQISSLAVRPFQESVWFTDYVAGKVYCMDDDGNVLRTISGFINPNAIDVHNQSGYCIVADKDSTVALGSRVRVVNKDGSGRIDTVSVLKLTGIVSALRIDQREVNDLWLLWQIPSGSDSTDKAVHYSSWWTLKSILSSGTKPVSIDINTTTGHAWIADFSGNQVFRVNTRNDSIARIAGFLHPQMVSVNLRDSSCWVVDTDNNRVVRLAHGVSNGYDINQGTTYDRSVTSFSGIGLKQPQALAVNPNEGAAGVVWVVDSQNNRIVKFAAADSRELLSIQGFGMETPSAIAVNAGTSK